MSLPSISSRQRRASAWAALTATLAAALLVACGGGAADPGTAAPSSPTATVYAAGPITGFGSVIVNGVRFDDTSASITDDDGKTMAESQLRLGMPESLTDVFQGLLLYTLLGCDTLIAYRIKSTWSNKEGVK